MHILQNEELSHEVMYLKKCIEIVETEKDKHIHTNSVERSQLEFKLLHDKTTLDRLETELKNTHAIKLAFQDKLEKTEKEMDTIKHNFSLELESIQMRCRADSTKINMLQNELIAATRNNS